MKKSDGGPYLHWIKSIADNKPYNQFVYELVSAEGPLYKPGNGAAGYYLRDYRMPLDNVASTMQIFSCYQHGMCTMSRPSLQRLDANGLLQNCSIYSWYGNKRKEC